MNWNVAITKERNAMFLFTIANCFDLNWSNEDTLSIYKTNWIYSGIYTVYFYKEGYYYGTIKQSYIFDNPVVLSYTDFLEQFKISVCKQNKTITIYELEC